MAFRLRESAPTPVEQRASPTPVDGPGPKGSATIVRQLPASPSVANFATGMAPPLPVLDNEAANEAARIEADTERRIALYQEVEKQLIDEAVWIPLFFDVTHALVKPEVVGYEFPPSIVERFRDVEVNR